MFAPPQIGSGHIVGALVALWLRFVAAVTRLTRSFLGLGQSIESTGRARTSWGCIPILSLTSALALALIAITLSPVDHVGSWQTALFCAGVILLFFPLATRIVWPSVSRFEQIGLLLVAIAGLYGIKLLTSPFGFAGFDEFLHWATAEDILIRHRLFGPNTLLPISPLYPGLEIVATAVVNITGLPLFASAFLLLAVSRFVFIGALFLFFETVTRSSRLAAIACIVYMGNASFPLFHISFSYESLAVVFAVLVFLAASRIHVGDGDQAQRSILLATPFIAALAVTHHLTAYIATAMLALITVIAFAGRAPRRVCVALAILTAMSAFFAWSWMQIVGNPIGEYLGPSLGGALSDFTHLLTTWSLARKPFVSTDGSVSPLWQRATMLSALLLICLGLAMGFFRALHRAGATLERVAGRIPFALRWRNDWLVFFVVLACAFPLTVIFRLSASAWEIGNRLGPHVHLGVAPLVAIAIAGAWQGRSTSAWRAMAVGAAITVTLAGGVFTAWGGPVELPRRYRVIADQLSVEPMGIEAAQWTKTWLGPDRRFVADRINRILLTTYGEQQVVTQLNDEIDTSWLLFGEKLGSDEMDALKEASVDYLLIDMRLTQALPRLGVYFETGEDERLHETPPDARNLQKFNRVPHVSRPYDNGYIVLYDVASLVKRLRDGQ